MKLEIADLEVFKPILKPLLKEVVTEVMQELKQNETPVLINTNKAAKIIGCSFGYVETLINEGKLIATSDGKRIHQASIFEYLNIYGKRKSKEL